MSQDMFYEPKVSTSKPPRGHSYTYVQSSTPYRESGEGQILEALGCMFTLPASSCQPSNGCYAGCDCYSRDTSRCRRDPGFDAQPRAPVQPRVVKPPAPPVATEQDAANHKMPPGFSLKDWDPRERPILLLGSVFDANSLGKWIYDLTVYKVGTRGPLAEVADRLWLLLVDISEKSKYAKQIAGSVRSKEERQIVEQFLGSSERRMNTLQLLLKTCEAPMLKASSKNESLGQKSGIEFIDTLFGRGRELSRTERFMRDVRRWLH
uniref:Integrase catalytic domain-containing protein n=1 Tax=Bionectria ochroleuca TaxID=29856 RepID=A0A8H7K8V0_BIOOC